MHTIPHFQEELQQLKTRLLEMGGLAEERVRSVVQALVDRNAQVVDRVLAGDGPINQLHIEIDSRCFKLLALHQPMAVDLRAIVSAVKINTDLERVGDLAINIAEAVKRYMRHSPVKELIDIPGWRTSPSGCSATRSMPTSAATSRWRRRCSMKTTPWTR